MAEWIVSFPDRLDIFLSSEGRTLSRSAAQRAIEEGHVQVNDIIVTKAAHRLQEGDQVTVAESGPRSDDTIEPTDLQLPILYEDAACIVINKPVGFAVHPGAGMAPGEKTILHGVAFLFAERSLPFSPDSVLVHRLDKETTGCLLTAKTPAAHQFLQNQFEERSVQKTYLALVAGVPSPLAATIDSPIGRSSNNRTKMGIFHISKGREAQTTYRVVSVSPQKDASLLECSLHTGRTHQIRVHLAAIGHPVLGDDSYTSAQSERVMDEYDVRSLCLHAWKLTFVSPADTREHALEASLSDVFRSTMEKLGLAL